MDFRLYAQSKRSDPTLHLSEHHGKTTLGSVVVVLKKVVFRWDLTAKNYKYAKPAIEDLPWGRMMELADPFGKKIRFCEMQD